MLDKITIAKITEINLEHAVKNPRGVKTSYLKKYVNKLRKMNRETDAARCEAELVRRENTPSFRFPRKSAYIQLKNPIQYAEFLADDGEVGMIRIFNQYRETDDRDGLTEISPDDITRVITSRSERKKLREGKFIHMGENDDR